MNTVSYTFTIKAYRKNDAETALAEFNKKAEKLGCDPLQITVIKEFVTKSNRSGGPVTDLTLPCDIVKTPMLELELTGSVPKLGDYDVVGYTESLPTGNIVTNILQDENIDLTPYRDRITCDHCDHNRSRLYTWILRKTGDTELFQVGTTCVKDYTGHDPYKIVRILTWFNDVCENMEDEDFGMGGGSGRRQFNAADWIAYVLYLTETCKHAYVSYSRADIGKPATDSMIWNSFLPDNERLTPSAEQFERSKELFKWALAHDTKADYWYNLVTLLELAENNYGFLPAKYSGYVASIPAAYHRESAKEKEQKEQIKKSEHIGQIKEKLELEVECTRIFGFDGFYGWTEYILFKTVNGNVLKWQTSSEHAFEVDKTYKIKATVKKHSVYQEIKQTEIVRVKQV